MSHNEHFLHHPAIQTLIHSGFFGDPVGLEPVEDLHLLGFNIDLSSRSITYMHPAFPNMENSGRHFGWQPTPMPVWLGFPDPHH